MNTAGSAPYASAGSLSGALLSDNPVSPIATGRSGMDILHRTSSEDTSIHQSTKPAYSNGTVGQSGVRRSSKPGQIEINSSGGNPRHGSWRIEDTGRTSDRTTPTHSSSHHSGSQARHNVPPLNVLPNKNLFRGSGTARSAPYASARSFRSGYTDNQGLGSGIAEEAYDMEDQVFYPLLRTYTIVTAILLKRCIVDDTFLDQSCCVCSESVAAPRRPLDADGSLGIAASLEVEHANIVFSIREFLAASALYSNITVSIAELSKQSHPALGRLTKLLHGGYLSTCLPLHMDTGEKIGEGAFGTVFRITCPENCGAFKKFSNCYNCYAKQCNMVGEYCDEPCCDSLTAAIGRSARQFAVKRIPRERSVFDNPAIFHLFNEISALECMRGCIGVCSVEDYGVCGAEYWLIMESGSLNLSEWRLTPTDSTDSTREVGYTNFDDAVDVSKVATLSDLLVYLSVFLEVLMIVRSVHIADVAHFDIKSNNFVLRKDPRSSFKSMLEMHDKDQLSGVLFLADFGEAITNISKPRSRAAVVKSRGTVSIQSPEMLCINAADPLSSKPSSNINESIPIHSSSSVFSKVNTPSNAKSERKQFDLPDKTSDVWSLGCLLVEILTSETLFANRSWPELYVSLCMNNFRPVSLRYIRHAMDSFNRSLITKIETIARGALQQDPNDRSTIEDLIFDTKRVIHELLKNKVEENEQLSLQNKSGSSKDLYKKQESEYFDVQISNNNSPRSRAGSLFLGRRTHSSSALPAPMSIISSPRVTEEDARVLHSMDERTAPIHTRSFRVYEDMYFNLERNHHILEDYFESNGAMGRANDLTSHASLLSRVAVVDQTIKKADIDYAVADMSRKLMMRNRLNRRYAFVRIIPLCNSESSLEVPGQNKHREDDVEYISNGNFDYWVCTLRICEDYSILSGRLAKIVDRMVEHTLLENCIIIVSIEPIKQQTGGKDGSLSARKSSHHGTSSSQSNINSGSTSTNNCLKLPLPANSTEESYCYTKRSIAVALAITCALQSRLRHQRLSGSRPKTTEYYILAKFFGESYQALMLLVRSLPGLEVNVSHDLLRVYLQFYLSEVSE